MALGISQISGEQEQVSKKLDNATSLLASTNSEIGETNSDLKDERMVMDGLKQEQSAADAQHAADAAQLAMTNSKLNGQEADLAMYQAMNNPLTKMYALEEFVVSNQGMCGMGMGMGGFGDRVVAVDGANLMALANSFKKNFTSLEEVVGDLKKQGVEAAVLNDGTQATDTAGKVVDGGLKGCIELKNANGSTTKVYDAQGNGMCDQGDYNFDKALAQFSADLKEYNKVVRKKTHEINETRHQRDKEAHQVDKDIVTKELIVVKKDESQFRSNTLNEQLGNLETQRDKTITTQNSLKQAKKELGAELQSFSSGTPVSETKTESKDKAANDNSSEPGVVNDLDNIFMNDLRKNPKTEI